MVRKILFFIFLYTSLIFPVFAENTTVLTGSVAYTVESARKLAFDGLELKLDKSQILPYRIDENNKIHKEALKNGTSFKNRTIMAFNLYSNKVNGYVIIYHDQPEYAYYYSIGGYLIAVDKDDKFRENIYPYKIGKYSPLTGNLISIALYISDEEQYAYTKNGKLKAHWVGNTGYNEKGKIIAKRSFVNEIPLD